MTFQTGGEFTCRGAEGWGYLKRRPIDVREGEGEAEGRGFGLLSGYIDWISPEEGYEVRGLYKYPLYRLGLGEMIGSVVPVAGIANYNCILFEQKNSCCFYSEKKRDQTLAFYCVKEKDLDLL